MAWDKVTTTLEDAKSIAWDGCHKIYVLMDDEQTEKMRSMGYGLDESHLCTVSEFANTAAVLDTLREWWADSCSLRFVEAVKTVPGDPNEGFTSLIGQFEVD